MRGFVWHEGDSFLHRLNPLTKLGAAFLAGIVVSTAGEPVTPIIVALAGVIATRLFGRVPWGLIARPLAFGGLAAFGVFWTYSLFYGGTGPAWVFGLTMAMRLLAILMASALFVLTTDPAEFVRSLIHQAHVSPRIAYSVFAGYRFVPLLEVEFDTIRAAHQMRGGASPSPLGRMRQVVGYAIPLLASAVRKGERVALAMESRGFGAVPQRTYFRTTTLGPADLVFLVCSLALFTGLLVARFHFAETL